MKLLHEYNDVQLSRRIFNGMINFYSKIIEKDSFLIDIHD